MLTTDRPPGEGDRATVAPGTHRWALGPRSGPARAGAAQGLTSAALALVTLVSAGGLFRVFAGSSWVWPVASTIVVVHGLLWLFRRLRYGQTLALLAAVVVLALMVSWTVFGYATFYGVPDGRTVSQIHAALSDLGNQFATQAAPVIPSHVFVLLAVLGAGLAAIVADWAVFRWKWPLVGLLPAVATFVYCCTAGAGAGRSEVIGFEVAAVCVYVLVERAGAASGQVWFAGSRDGVASSVVLTGGAIALAGLVTALAVVPALAPRDGVAMFGWRAGPGGGGSRLVPDPLVDLQTRLLEESDTPVFQVRSTSPSYWRLTALDTFDGDTWSSTGSYRGFGSRLPGRPPSGVSTRTVKASFTIQALDSVWLPSQFSPEAVTGAHDVTYDEASNSLISGKSTSDGQRYTVTAYQYLDTLTPAKLRAAPPPSTDNLGMDLSLPGDVPFNVDTLAQTIASSMPTEYDKALAIQNYLRSNYKYSLRPVSDGSAVVALNNFLFVTKEGYCQQFAGAFAVLARSIGLPTRLAIGFTTGKPVGGGLYQVTDADAHTWPEVYFGPQYGWVPFEPTPGFGVPGASKITLAPVGSPTGPVTSSPTTAPSTATSSPATTAKPTTARTKPLPDVGGGSNATHSGGVDLSIGWLALPALLLLWIGANTIGRSWLRRSRRSRAATGGAGAIAVNAWSELTTDMAWSGIRRDRSDTDDEFARRAEFELGRLGVGGPWQHGGVRRVAAYARRATYAASVPIDMGRDAETAAHEVERRIRAETPWPRRLVRCLIPPPGTGVRLKRLLRADNAGGLMDGGMGVADAGPEEGGELVGAGTGSVSRFGHRPVINQPVKRPGRGGA